ncbi:hypothetical protein RIF29_20801 [Crotalaria pallida]|uniref:Uncharacterized protein n=1 Tax=Crotalaria pallida TaxID=3830 RepID=A0AAN9F3M0_CROPI
MGTQYSKFSNGVVSNRNNNGRFDGSSYSLYTPPSIRKFQAGKSVLKCKTPISNAENIQVNMSGYGSCNSSVTHNSEIMFTPASVLKLQSRSNLLKSKRTNSDICENATMFTPCSVSNLQPGRTNSDRIDKGVISVQSYKNRSVLSDITNISHSTNQCSRYLSQLYERDSDMLAREVQNRKRVSFSSQNLDELYSIFSDCSLSKKRKSTLFEASQNRSVLSDVTNISHSNNECSKGPHITQLHDNSVSRGSSNEGASVYSERLEHKKRKSSNFDRQDVPENSSNKNKRLCVDPHSIQGVENGISSGTSSTCGIPAPEICKSN